MTSPHARPAGYLSARIALGLAGLWVVMALLTWAGLQNGVRVSSPFATFGYGQAPLFSAPVNILHVAGVLIWNGLAALIGYAFVIRPIWGGKWLAGPHWMLFAGVVPGALMIGAVTRLITLFLPNDLAAMTVGGIVLAAALYAAFLTRPTGPIIKGRAPPVWQWLLVSALALIASLIFQLHMDRGHAVAEGSIWFINEIFLSPVYGIGADGYLPLFPQHYDEVAFLHPLVYLAVSPGPDASASLTLIYWMTLATSRIGMIALTYIAIRGLSVDRLSAFACTAFVCMASLSLNPFSSRLLFDSLSPMAYTLHMTRFLAPVLPLLIVSALAQGAPRFSGQAIAAALILGIGLAATPIHFVMLALWAGAILLVFALTKRETAPPLRTAVRVAAAVLALTSLAYLLKDVSAAAGAGLLALASLGGGAALLVAAVRGGLRLPDWRGAEARAVGLFILVMAGFGFGLIFLGNVGILKLDDFFGHLPPWNDREVVIRLAGHIISPEIGLRASPFCATGSEWGYRTITGHCGSLPVFVRTYGLPFVLITAALAAGLLMRRPADAPRANTLDQLSVWGMALCLLALPLSFLIFDFLTPDGSDPLHAWSIWLRSRLIEPWFVGGILLALAFILRTAGRQTILWVNLALLAAVAIYALNPLIAPAQWAANVAYWMEAIF